MIVIHENQPKTVFESKGYLYCPCCKSDFRRHENGGRTVFSCGTIGEFPYLTQTKKCKDRTEKLFYFNQAIKSVEDYANQLIETNNSLREQLEILRSIPKIESGRYSNDDESADNAEGKFYEDEPDLKDEYEDEDDDECCEKYGGRFTV